MSDERPVDPGHGAAPPWRGVRAVLFDLDGTLVRSEIDFPAMRRETLAAAVRHGAAVEALAELDALAIVRAAAGQVRELAAFQEEVEALLQAIELRACAGAEPMPGAVELLPWLAEAGLRVGIV